MKLDLLYKSLADEQRQRILNLLFEGPLCVCYLQEILDEGQVKVSKQLGFLKRAGLVEASREGFWMIYRLIDPVPPLLQENLLSLRKTAPVAAILAEDLTTREEVFGRLQKESGDRPRSLFTACCSS